MSQNTNEARDQRARERAAQLVHILTPDIELVCRHCGRTLHVARDYWAEYDGLFTCEADGDMLLTRPQFDYLVETGHVRPENSGDKS